MKLQVFYDYTCPFCYLGLSYLQQLLPQYPQLEVEWHPCEAHPRPELRMDFSPTDGFWRKGISPSAEAEHIPLQFPLTPVAYSDKAIEGFFFLQDQGGDLEAYNHAIYEAVYVKRKNIEDRNIVTQCLVIAGADESESRTVLENGTYAQHVTEANQLAYETHGIEVVPHMIYGEQEFRAKLGYGITKENLKLFLDSL